MGVYQSERLSTRDFCVGWPIIPQPLRGKNFFTEQTSRRDGNFEAAMVRKGNRKHH